MKRIIVFLIVVLMMFIGIPCAAVMELSFNDSIAEYREASAVMDSACARAVCDDGCVKIAFADGSAVSGKLFCRVAFKALQVGTCSFIHHIAQVADAEPKLLDAFPDTTLEVKTGKDAVSVSASSKSSLKSNRVGLLSSIKEAIAV